MDHSKFAQIMVSGQEKIKLHHLHRLAYIYIRQSTPGQVLHHQESQRNQIRLVERAKLLGWSLEDVQVITTDQGLSAKHSGERDGFRQLVSEVSLGQVGIIFSYEVSRLARNSRDWYDLLEVAAVFDTLIADYDGIYDLHLFNDRLLLGLKGTMSEAELHLLKLRLEAGRQRQIERGVYRQCLPTGLERLPDGSVVKDPDAQVRHTLELVFAKFEELGSCNKVLKYLRQANLLLPRRQMQGPEAGKVVWKPVSYGAVYAILTNPAYAGAFVYGRKQVDKKYSYTQAGSTPKRVWKPIEQWSHIQYDVYPAYISWEDYLAIREQLSQNQARPQSATMPRKGAALLQGIVWCGCCGQRMEVSYQPRPRYSCQGLVRRFGGPFCAFLNATVVDEAVVEAFLEAIQPAQLDLLEAVLQDQAVEYRRLNQQWQDRLRRVEYEVHLAQRQYRAVDPDNRLVAAELERRWEMALRQLQEVEQEYEKFQQKANSQRLSEELRFQFQHLSENLPKLWHTGQIPNDQKKTLLRALISSVILTRPQPDQIEAKIVWVSGHYSIFNVQTPVQRNSDVSNYEQLLSQIHSLWQQDVSDANIAVQLTAAGFHSARSSELSAASVQKIRLSQGWYRSKTPPKVQKEGYWTIADLAAQFDVKPMMIYQRIRRGKISDRYIKRHPRSRTIFIQDCPEALEQLQLI